MAKTLPNATWVGWMVLMVHWKWRMTVMLVVAVVVVVALMNVSMKLQEEN